MSDNAVEIIEADAVEAKSKPAEKVAEESKDTPAAKVNGTDSEAKKEDATSPMPGPGEIENMTVVDEDVEMLSSDDDEKTNKDEKKDDSSQSKTAQKRKADGAGEGSKSKKSVTADDGKTSDSDSKKEAKDGDAKGDDRSSKTDRTAKTDRSSKNDRSSKGDDKGDGKKEKSGSEKKELPKTLPLLEKYWKAVKDDPNDFTGWTYLLQYVDQANDIKAASEVYDDFLSRYPYCYGYWRKYADYLKKNGHKDKCEETFEKGIKAVPLSVDLWIHYLNYKKDAYSDDEPTVRKLFERSLQSCGLEFRSDRLWDAYVKWEADNGNLFRITNIFDRWLKVPTQGYVSVMDKFKEHVKKNSPNKILDPEEFFTLRNEVLNETRANNTEMECKLSDDLPPGEECPDKLDKMNEEETKALKEKIVNNRKEIHKTTQKEALARWTFEENIKRPYFHVKPLEQCQLNNWREYLEFEIKEGSQDRIILLFERCLIACALYEEFWIKFVEYLLSMPEVPVDKVREVFVRACTIHHPKKLSIHLKWAAFEESYGNSEKAAEILEKLENECPNVLSLILRRINVIRRRHEYEKVCSLYELYIEQNQDKREFASSLSIKYARFCCKFLKNVEKGIEILKAAVEKDKNNSRLRLQLIDLYMGQTPVNEAEIVKVMDEVIDQETEVEKKLLFAQRKLEFLEEFSENSVSIQKAQEVYDTQVKLVADKKRQVEEKRTEGSSKKNGAPEPSGPAAASVAYSPTTATTYYQAGTTTTYQTYPQGYIAQYPQQQIYTQGDPSYGYQNWPTYGAAYNQTWTGAATPGAAGGYNYMY